MGDAEAPERSGESAKRVGPVAIGLMLVAIWLVFPFIGFLGLVPGGRILYPVAVALVLVWLLWRRAFVGFVVVLLLCPFSVFFLRGASGYLAGRPTLLGIGLPGTTYHNIDGEYRCQRETLGDLVGGHEWVIYGSNNAAVKLMVRVFGPARGSYTGPYPTEEQALAALGDATPVRLDRFLQDRVILGDREVRLDTGVGKALLRDGEETEYIHEAWPERPADEPGPIRCAIWRDRCLIIRIPTRYPWEEELPPDVERSARIAVVDTERGRPFAYFATGKYHHRWPPVRWRPGG